MRVVKSGAIVPVEKCWDAAEINWRPVGLMGRSDRCCLGTEGKGRDMQMGFHSILPPAVTKRNLSLMGSENLGLELDWVWVGAIYVPWSLP